MWRLLPLSLLVACAVTDPFQPTSSDGPVAAESRVLQVVEMPLGLAQPVMEGEPARRPFRDFNVSGWLDENGYWGVHAEVSHGRIRCATYETGVQIGRGRPACSAGI